MLPTVSVAQRLHQQMRERGEYHDHGRYCFVYRTPIWRQDQVGHLEIVGDHLLADGIDVLECILCGCEWLEPLQLHSSAKALRVQHSLLHLLQQAPHLLRFIYLHEGIARRGLVEDEERLDEGDRVREKNQIWRPRLLRVLWVWNVVDQQGLSLRYRQQGSSCRQLTMLLAASSNFEAVSEAVSSASSHSPRLPFGHPVFPPRHPTLLVYNSLTGCLKGYEKMDWLNPASWVYIKSVSGSGSIRLVLRVALRTSPNHYGCVL